MEISFRRHGDWNRGTGDLTPETKILASKKAENYDRVFSSPVWRCIETASYLSKNRGNVQTYEIFTDLRPTEDPQDRAYFIEDFLRQFEGSEGKVLIISHSNLISALDLIAKGGMTPKDINDLPEVSNLEGFDTYI